MIRRMVAAVVLTALLCTTLTGCFFRSMDELYTLPKQSEDYKDLQKAIDATMSGYTNAAYCAPVSGSNQQAVQLADLDGDGSEEALAFLKTEDEKPLKIVVFKKVDEVYTSITAIESAGSTFSSVEYLQLDGMDGLEILVGRQVSDQVLQSMGAYSVKNGSATELMSTTYSEYTTADLDTNGLTDIIVLRFDAEQSTGVVERYCYTDGTLERDPEAMLSTGVDTVKRIITGYIQNHVPAVFVASVYQDTSIVSDVFALRKGTLVNVTARADTGTSAQTVRNYFVYATDIDDDGLIELPAPEQLRSYGGAGETYWIIRWYNVALSGETRTNMTTFHNYSGGWYLELPDVWAADVVVSRGNEVGNTRGYVFSQWKSELDPPEEIFTIYEFSGEARNTLAAQDGRFIIGEKGDVTFAAALSDGALAAAITKEDLASWFHFIMVDWNTGEM